MLGTLVDRAYWLAGILLSIAMSKRIGLSKSKLLSFHQCRRRLWLEQHSPDLAETSADAEGAFATGNVVGGVARQIYGHGEGHYVSFDGDVDRAIATTRELLADGGDAPIFEATFEHDGLVVRTDIFDRSEEVPRIVEVKASTYVREHHVIDCAIQAWTLQQLGFPLRQVAVAHVDSAFVYQGDGRYEKLFAEEDVTELVKEHFAIVPRLVEQARATLAGAAEPVVEVGPHCDSPYPCPFYDHCAPPQGEFPVWDLGGRHKKLFALIHAGHQDLRDVPRDALAGEKQRRIWEQTKIGMPFVGAELADFAARLEFPRYYLDFETIAFAVPIWAGTRPYEALPFQWSCHIDNGRGELAHENFLDVTGKAPMRACADHLIAMLGHDGPILVYTGYEGGVINRLAERYADLAIPLQAIRDRLVDLHPVTKAHYYHPAMHGSWSIKSVLPTIAPDLDYTTLGEVQDGGTAQIAYLEAINPKTPPERHQQLRKDLLDYCNFDTLALVKLVEYFSGR
jgi:hypothetical protein